MKQLRETVESRICPDPELAVLREDEESVLIMGVGSMDARLSPMELDFELGD
jgi:hypothetical protein